MDYITRRLVADRHFVHEGRELRPGDTFAASPVDAGYLTRNGRAHDAPADDVAPAPAAPAPVSAPVAEAPPPQAEVPVQDAPQEAPPPAPAARAPAPRRRNSTRGPQ